MSSRLPVFLRGFIFVIFFFVDVRVRADVVNLPVETQPVLVPAGCKFSDFGCAVKTRQGRKFSFDVKGNTEDPIQVTLGSDSAVMIDGDSSLTFLKGRMMVFSEGVLSVSVPSGKIQISGFVLLDYEKNRVTVRPIEGDATLVPISRSEAQEIPIPAGIESWMGLVDDRRQVATGIPRAQILTQTLLDWAQLTALTRDDFSTHAREFRETHSNAVIVATKYLKEKADREIASAETAQARRRQLAREREMETSRLKKMFWEKTFGVDPIPVKIKSAQ